MIRVLSYFKEQIAEIQSEKSLMIYGFFLALTNCWTYLLWNKNGSNFVHIFNDTVVVCWPFFSDCSASRSYFGSHINEILIIYFMASLFVALFFLRKSLCHIAYWGLLVVTLFKFVLLIQDYRFMGNYHYIAFLCIFVFLLVPHKVFFTKCTLVACYLGAGLVRFNMDWFAGLTLTNQTLISGKALEWSMAYVVFLELCLSLLLLSKRAGFFWFAFFQFAIFHSFSYFEVGYFFPLVMVSLLSILVLDRFWSATFQPKFSKNFGYACLCVFAFAQIYPAVVYPESAKTGEGRILALNMFDGKIVCENRMMIRYKNQTINKSIPDPKLGKRINCDPIFYFNYLKTLCSNLIEETDFVDLDINFMAKRSTETTYSTIFKSYNFCTKPPVISWLGVITKSE